MTFSSVISVPRPYSKDGAPSCGIYLSAPKKMRFKQFVLQLRAALNAINSSPYKNNMHAVEFTFPDKIFEKEREQASVLVGMCKGAGVVPIIRDDLGLCVECDAEGLILSEIEKIGQARHILGEKAIIGLDCRNSQDFAEAALVNNVDYVSFSTFYAPKTSKKHADISLLERWGTTTHLPAASFAKMDTVAQAIELTKAGAGFIGAGAFVWEHEQGPKQAVYLLQEAIEYGLSQIKIN